MRFPFISLFLIAWPLAEIAGFVLVGRAVGLWATLGLVIGTAVIGALLIRGEGINLLRRLSSEGRQGRMPARSVIDGAVIVIAGMLLFLPGFVSDIIGLALLVPLIRNLLWSVIGSRMVTVHPQDAGQRHRHPASASVPGASPNGPVVDLDEEDFTRDPNPSSPWSENPRIDQ